MAVSTELHPYFAKPSEQRRAQEVLVTVGELRDAVRRALNIFDKWNDCTGAITKGTSTYYEMQGVIEDAVHCGAQAANKDFRKLPSEEA